MGFFHSVMFDNEGEVVNLVDESFASRATGCPPMTTYQPRPWNPAGDIHATGRMFFVDMESGDFLSDFQVGDLRPEPGAYCSAHMGMAVMDIQRDLLVNAWYEGGGNVIDFTQATRLKEIAHYDIAPAGPTGADNWSAYQYVGPRFEPGGPKGQAGIPVYASRVRPGAGASRGRPRLTGGGPASSGVPPSHGRAGHSCCPEPDQGRCHASHA